MQIERYAPTWHRKVVDLAKEAFGEGYFSKPGEIAGDPDTIMLVSTETDDQLLGLVQGRLLPENARADYLEHQVSDVPNEVAAADRDGALGVIEIVAVAKAQRGTGLGTRLISAMRAPVPAALPTAETFFRSQSGMSPSTIAYLGSMKVPNAPAKRIWSTRSRPCLSIKSLMPA